MTDQLVEPLTPFKGPLARTPMCGSLLAYLGCWDGV